MAQYSISITKKSSPSHEHNERRNPEDSKKNPRIDPSRSHLNVTLIPFREPREVMDEYCKEDFEEFQNKYKKKVEEGKASPKPRKVYQDAYDVIMGAGQPTSRKARKGQAKRDKKDEYELVFQIGNKDYRPSEEECITILSECVEEFQKMNPNFIVTGAVVHRDEATPHVHLNYIPFYTKATTKIVKGKEISIRIRGLKHSVNHNLAMQEALGLPIDKNKTAGLYKTWRNELMDRFEKVLERHGHSRFIVGDKSKHLDPNDYKKVAQEEAYTKRQEQVAQAAREAEEAQKEAETAKEEAKEAQEKAVVAKEETAQAEQEMQVALEQKDQVFENVAEEWVKRTYQERQEQLQDISSYLKEIKEIPEPEEYEALDQLFSMKHQKPKFRNDYYLVPVAEYERAASVWKRTSGVVKNFSEKLLNCIDKIRKHTSRWSRQMFEDTKKLKNLLQRKIPSIVKGRQLSRDKEIEK